MSIDATVRLQPGAHTRIAHGHPWAFSNEIVMGPEAKTLARGSIVRVVGDDGRDFGAAFFNPHSLISLRLLRSPADRPIDAQFLGERLSRALTLRQALYDEPFYRLVHAEADSLPGLIVDRYGDVLSVQANCAGMDNLIEELVGALTAMLQPRTIVLRSDSSARTLEGLERSVRVVGQPLAGPIGLRENGATFRADLEHGQKTGWFFDQRDNRAFMAALCQGRRVADFYTYLGGFAI